MPGPCHSSVVPSSNVEVAQPIATSVPATNTGVATLQCQEKVEQRHAVEAFDTRLEVQGIRTRPMRLIEWVSGVPIPRRRVRWTPRSKYCHSSPPPPPPPPPPRPPKQSCSGQVLTPKSPSWSSLQSVTWLWCNAELCFREAPGRMPHICAHGGARRTQHNRIGEGKQPTATGSANHITKQTLGSAEGEQDTQITSPSRSRHVYSTTPPFRKFSGEHPHDTITIIQSS